LLAAVTCALLLVGVGASARELTLEVQTDAIYDDNIFSTSGDKTDDFYFRLAPRIGVEESRGKLQWLLQYTPSYNVYATERDLDGFDHDVRAQVSYRLGPRTQLTFSDRFRRAGFETRFNETTDVAEGDDPIVTLANQRARLITNFAQVGLTHRLSPRQSVSILGFHQIFDRQSDSADTEGYGVSAQYFYTFNERLQMGPQLIWNRRIQKPVTGRDIETDFLNLSGRAVFEISPGFTLNFSAGPALVFSDETELVDSAERARYPGPTENTFFDARTCPTLDDGSPFLGVACEQLVILENASFGPGSPSGSLTPALDARQEEVTVPFVDPPSSGGSELTFFADITLRKRWQNWIFQLGYRRSDDSSASNFGVTAVTDRVFATLEWQATRKLELGLAASWLGREQNQELVSTVTGLQNSTLVLDGILTTATVANVAEAISLRGIRFDSDFQSDTYSIQMRARYRLRERVALRAVASFRQQEQSGAFVSDSTIEQFIVRLGFDYSFEPWRF
ncbi:MAG: hypothetical protein QNK05_22190, partial [Myxococcota bacterium]|nr:hypothetical protein [Myxococcota bacterium]